VQRFKTAAFAAAIAAGAPVVPIALEGADRILPRDSLKGRPGRVRVAVGEPIPTGGLTRDARAALARRAQERVESLLADLRREPLPAASVADRAGLLEA
jgi:1-acyl-sn-glycerol-3-phosphate acyltransferase